MKAVVMEVDGGFAAVLTDDGRFIKVVDNGYEPGMELSLKKTDSMTASKQRKLQREERETASKNKTRKVLPGKFRRFAAVAAASIGLIFGINLYYTPYAVISLDVNPSIEITVNRFGKVLDVEAVNGDGAELAETLLSSGVKNQSYDAAVDMALQWVNEGDYAADDGRVYVVLSASADDEAYSEELAGDLANRTASYKNVSAEVIKATEEEAEEAKELGTTAGKIHLVNQLEEKEPEIEKKEWVKRPVKDIVSEIKRVKSEEEPEEKPEENPEETQATEVKDKPEEEPEETQATEVKEKPEEKPEENPEKNPEETQATEVKEKPEEKPEENPEEKPEETQTTEVKEKPEETQATEDKEKPEEKPEENPEETQATEVKENPEEKPEETQAAEVKEKPEEKQTTEVKEKPEEKPEEIMTGYAAR